MKIQSSSGQKPKQFSFYTKVPTTTLLVLLFLGSLSSISAIMLSNKKREKQASQILSSFMLPKVNTIDTLRINVGSEQAYFDTQGKTWQVGNSYISGNTRSSQKDFDVQGTEEDALFLSYCYANNGADFSYQIPVNQGGLYKVNLYFMEPYFGLKGPSGTGRRQFDVDIENVQETGIDLNAIASPGSLIRKSYENVEVLDSVLNIVFHSTINNAIISAIEIIPTPNDSDKDLAYFIGVSPQDQAINVALDNFQITVGLISPDSFELDKNTLDGNVKLFEKSPNGEIELASNINDTGGGDAITLTLLNSTLKPATDYVFRIDGAEANRVGDLEDRIYFQAFESTFRTMEEDVYIPINLEGVSFTKIEGPNLGEGTFGSRYTSLVIGPDRKLYASTAGESIHRWDIQADGTLSNFEALNIELQGAEHPDGTNRDNDQRLIIGLAFDPASTPDSLIAYISHSQATLTNAPPWDGVVSRLSGPKLSTVEDIIIHLPRSTKDHLSNSLVFHNEKLYLSQGSNTAGGEIDPAWANRPERLLSGAILEIDPDKLPATLPLSVFTSDDISIINLAAEDQATLLDGTYNPYSLNAALSIFCTGTRNTYDLVWHSNGYLYLPTNGTAGNNTNSPNTPASADYLNETNANRIRRADGTFFTNPDIPGVRGGESQKDWLFKARRGSYHGHPNPLRGEFILNHGGQEYQGLPGQTQAHVDVEKYPDNLGPDANFVSPAFDFGFNVSPNGAIEYQSNAFNGKLKGMLMVTRFSGQDDILIMKIDNTTGDIIQAYSEVPGFQGFDDPLDMVEDPETGNVYLAQYDRSSGQNQKIVLLRADVPANKPTLLSYYPEELIFETTVNTDGPQVQSKTLRLKNISNRSLTITTPLLTGTFADQFSWSGPESIQLAPQANVEYEILYSADLVNTNLGFQSAQIDFSLDSLEDDLSIGLYALKKKGYEGSREPDLQDVVWTLGYNIDVGWNSLVSNTEANPMGEEVIAPLFMAASSALVGIKPVARYSPAEELPFGWYTYGANTVDLKEVGILDEGLNNAQALFPPLKSGGISFVPQNEVFGIYVESKTFGRINYSEDDLNIPSGVAHRVRTYPLRDREGNSIANTYLICFEDATNGDYQDYCFVLSNVKIAQPSSPQLVFEPKNIDLSLPQGFGEFSFEAQIGTSKLQDLIGLSLISSQSWLELPNTDSLTLNQPLSLSINETGLEPGDYTAKVTANAEGFIADTLQVNLRVFATSQARFYLEAECAEVGSNWVQGNSVEASNGNFLEINPNDGNFAYAGSAPAAIPANRVRFQFSVSEAGDYAVWARTKSSSSVDDSYYISVNEGPARKWNGLYDAEDLKFKWDLLLGQNLNLDLGINTIDFYYRENGAQLDKLLIQENSILDIPEGSGSLAINCGSLVNLAPKVQVAKDTTLILGTANVVLNAQVEDDGLPVLGSLQSNWEVVSGEPSQVLIDQPELISTPVSFLALGEYTLRLRVSDGELSAEDDIVVRVLESLPNTPPEFQNIEDILLLENTRLSLDILLEDAEGDSIQVNLGNAPDFVTLEGLNLIISPPLESQGTYTVQLDANDAQGGSTSISFSLQVLGESITFLNLEAECSQVGSNWLVGEDNNASENKYVEIQPNNSSFAYAGSPPDSRAENRIRFQFNISDAGTYRIFARTQGASYQDDSFYISINGGEAKKWNGLHDPQQLGFKWDELLGSAQNLSQGLNTIDFYYRENGAQLDKIYLAKLDLAEVPLGKGGLADNNCSSQAKIALQAQHKPSEKGLDLVKVYPNPASQKTLNLVFDNDLVNDLDYVMYSPRGEIALQGKVKIKAKQAQINVETLKPGVYILNMRNETNQTVFIRFVKL